VRLDFTNCAFESNGLGQCISWFKRLSINEYIRDEKSLLSIREYIHNNPKNWEEDEENTI